jgi:predicted Fe-Mo cluster-binding NifX family protein
MKIAVTATGKDLSADVDTRFGRAAYFVIVDPETKAFETVENSQHLGLPQGAGIQAGKTIVDRKVDVLITGNCGPKAFQVLNQGGVQIMTGASGSVMDAITAFQRGELATASSPNVEGHWV